ncbi:HTH-type transcriptional regulator DmlR [Burkholderia sp. AD24]|nr:HTH-type transcriptional regulator DmlR [Burkholderia sp. AD24]
MTMDTFLRMKAFARVVECGNFTKASTRLNMSLAQVSRAISELEEHLRTRLLNRTTRQVSLTEAGERYLHKCYSILSMVEAAEAEASNAHVLPSGRLRVHATASFGQRYVAPATMVYQSKYPDVAVELTLEQRVPDLLTEGYDVSVQLRSADQPDSALISVPVGRSYSILCASPSYLRSHGTPRKVSELVDHACLQTANPNSLRGCWSLEGPSDKPTVDLPPARFQVNIAEAMVTALRAGMGIGALPLWTASPWLRNGTLIRVLPEYRLSEMQISIVYASRQFLDAKIRSWIDFSREYIPTLLDQDEPMAKLAEACS